LVKKASEIHFLSYTEEKVCEKRKEKRKKSNGLEEKTSRNDKNKKRAAPKGTAPYIEVL
jgi:hypothetical protein